MREKKREGKAKRNKSDGLYLELKIYPGYAIITDRYQHTLRVASLLKNAWKCKKSA